MSTPSEPNGTRLRLRAALDAQFAVIVAACLIAVLLGAGLVYGTHVDPGTETEVEVVSSWSVETEYVHAATVTEPNSVFPLGEELTDRNTYFTRIAPELDVEVVTEYDAVTAESVDVDTESVLVVRNVEDGTVYWEETETLATETATDVGDDETAGVSFALNSTAIDEEVTRIEDELGASPGQTETFVATDVELEGTLNGEPVTYTTALELDVTHAGDTYTVEDPGVQSETVDQTEPVERERTYGPLRTLGSPLLLLFGIAGTAGMVYARREGLVGISDAERAYLEFSDARSEFDEWITRVRLPSAVHDRAEGEAESLRDLVDFAIDNDVGVVEDPNTGAFHAVTDEFVYTYVPPELASVASATPPGEDLATVGHTAEGDDASGGAETSDGVLGLSLGWERSADDETEGTAADETVDEETDGTVGDETGGSTANETVDDEAPSGGITDGRDVAEESRER